IEVLSKAAHAGERVIRDDGPGPARHEQLRALLAHDRRPPDRRIATFREAWQRQPFHERADDAKPDERLRDLADYRHRRVAKAAHAGKRIGEVVFDARADRLPEVI